MKKSYKRKSKSNKSKIAITAGIIATISSLTVYQISDKQADKIPEYSRKDYKHWIDEDKDCQDTRQEVLIAESVIKVKLDKKGCRVLSGKWYDPYTDKYFTDPGDLDVDHFVPLKEVHRSGGYIWDKDKKQEYANDLKNSETLIAVDKSANRSKSDKDPASWLPKNEKYVCEYIAIWTKIKSKWDLKYDQDEYSKIEGLSKKCKSK